MLASSHVYLIMVMLFCPAQVALGSGYSENFVIRITTAKVASGIVVQILLMGSSRPVRAYLTGQSG
jgi:hypothetical protein